MEKLQKALAKAREQRGSGAPTSSATLLSPQAETPSSVDELWAELPSIDLDPADLEKQRILTTTAGQHAAAFDILRTKTMLLMRKNGWRRLAITSPTPGCGKTTTACNIALGMSRNPDIRVILMEFDLRRPTIRSRLNLPVRENFADMLTGRASFASQAVRYRDNVAICAVSEKIRDPSAILHGKAAQETLDRIEQDYAPDVMIFDIPPLLVSDDSHGLLKDVDCAMIIARADHSTVAQIDTCERTIAEQKSVLGVVLNQCRNADDTSGKFNYGG